MADETKQTASDRRVASRAQQAADDSLAALKPKRKAKAPPEDKARGSKSSEAK